MTNYLRQQSYYNCKSQIDLQKWVNGSFNQPKSLSFHFNPPQSSKICFTIGPDCERILWLQPPYAIWEDCKWIVRFYMDWKIAGFGTVGIVLPWPPPLCQKCAKKDWEDCIWIVSIVFGLCRLYLDCTIVFGLYNCIWIVQLYLDCTIAGFGTGGIVLPIPPPCAKNLCQKGFDRLYLDCVDCIWIV